jgi:hypothetical protein
MRQYAIIKAEDVGYALFLASILENIPILDRNVRVSKY